MIGITNDARRRKAMGRAIRGLRELQGLTQEKVATESGWKGPASLSAIERGERRPNEEKERAIAKALGITHEALSCEYRRQLAILNQEIMVVAGPRAATELRPPAEDASVEELKSRHQILALRYLALVQEKAAGDLELEQTLSALRAIEMRLFRGKP